MLKDFAGNLKRARTRAGLSQQALADNAKLSQASISLFEQGAAAPSLLVVFRLASALDIETAELLDGLRLSRRTR